MRKAYARTSVAGLLLGLTLVGVGCMTDTSATLTIVNQESYAITDIYLSPTGSFATTDNLLGSVPLGANESITVSVNCDTYDIEIIDDFPTDCKISSYDLCGTDDQFLLDDTFFATCH